MSKSITDRINEAREYLQKLENEAQEMMESPSAHYGTNESYTIMVCGQVFHPGYLDPCHAALSFGPMIRAKSELEAIEKVFTLLNENPETNYRVSAVREALFPDYCNQKIEALLRRMAASEMIGRDKIKVKGVAVFEDGTEHEVSKKVTVYHANREEEEGEDE